VNTELERRFWRLLTDYERLTQDESVAIHARDFDAVDGLQARKPPVLKELCALAGKTGLNRQNAPLAKRLAALERLETSSEEALATMLDESRTERQNLDSARQRLRSLHTSYGPDSHRPQAFCAHG
jgi:hypothetical protein